MWVNQQHTLISFNNKRFKEFISNIYPKKLTISETTESTSVASYLDLLFTRDRSNNITTKLYDKRDAFGFHIVNFPFMSSKIPSAPAYGVDASQLVRYARCCSSDSDFLIHHRALVKRLLSQGYKVNRLSNTFKKFYGRHTDLVGQYKKNVCQMFADSITYWIFDLSCFITEARFKISLANSEWKFLHRKTESKIEYHWKKFTIDILCVYVFQLCLTLPVLSLGDIF